MLPCFNVWSQYPAQYMKKGDEAVAENDWHLAFSYYEQGYLLDTSSFDMAVKYADAARNIRNYELAERLYAHNYEKDNGKLQPDELFWLALMQKNNGKYEDAQRNFKKYLKKHKVNGNRELIKRTDQEIKSAIWALDYKQVSQGITVSHPEGQLNTVHAEIAPYIMGHDVVFTSSRETAGDELWKLYRYDEANALHEMQLAGLPHGAAVGNFREGIDGRCYFSVKERGSTRIYSAIRNGDQLSDLRPLEEANGEGVVNTMPFPALIGERFYLFFVSDREGGEGGMDIWYLKSQKPFVKDNVTPIQFEKAKNIGSRYNTPGDELTPSYHEQQFAFSSDWHAGFGGLDVFSVQVQDFLTDKPVNLGKPINSSAHDFYYVHEGNSAWLSSNRKGSVVADSNATCCHDLYLINYPETEAPPMDSIESNKVISLKNINNDLPVVLYFHNDEPVPDSWDTTTTFSYLDAYESYVNKIPTYLKENTRGLSGERREEAETITADFFELKVKKGIQDLNDFSEALLKELERGRSLNVSVRGFASPRAQTDYNLNLTKRRTASLVNFMKSDSAGIFLPYIEDRATNGARLTFTLLPFGEVKADKAVSDDITDIKNSIYSRSACLERKIEIESVEEIEASVKTILPRLETDSFSFGVIPKLGTVKRSLQIFNDGNKPMVIDSVLAECGCTDPKLDKSVVLPGESANIEISFTPFGYKGHVVKQLMLYIAGEEPKIITFEAEVEK